MFCPECGTRARTDQKFCAECGYDLRDLDNWGRGADEDTGEHEVIVVGDGPPVGDVDDDLGDELDDGDDLAQFDEFEDEFEDDAVTDAVPTIQTADDAVTTTLAGTAAPAASTAPVDPMLARPPGSASPPQDRMWSVTGQQMQVPPPPPAWTGDPDATTRLPAHAPRPDEAPTRTDLPRVAADRTAVYGYPTPMPTATQPAVPGGWGWDTAEGEPAPPPRRTVRFRLAVLPAVAAVAAGALAVTRVLIELAPAAPVPGLGAGTWMVNDFGTNNTVAAILAMVALFGGALLWCFGFRWGAGLAGGGGLALAGWAGLLIGASELRLAIDEQQATAASVGLTMTRDVGYWSLYAAAGAGLLTFFASLSGAGRDRNGGLDPWIAALGATSVLVAAGGPLIPLGGADFMANFSSTGLSVDLPDAFFIGRLVQLGLFAVAGIIGFLLVRRYGLGLAIGGATVVGFQLATAATNQTTSPIGPGYANPPYNDLTPHGVTVVGMALAGFFALVAVVMALLDRGEPM